MLSSPRKTFGQGEGVIEYPKDRITPPRPHHGLHHRVPASGRARPTVRDGPRQAGQGVRRWYLLLRPSLRDEQTVQPEARNPSGQRRVLFLHDVQNLGAIRAAEFPETVQSRAIPRRWRQREDTREPHRQGVRQTNLHRPILEARARQGFVIV